MIVRELIGLLERADPDSLVLFLDDSADLSGADEIYDVIIPELPWVQVHGYAFGARFIARYPSELEECADDCAVAREPIRVVLLTNGPSKYRRLNLSERRPRG